MTKKRKGIPRPKKATHRVVNREFLNHRVKYSASLGYGKQKWIEFCEAMIARGFTVSLYEARQTVSKYVTVRHNGQGFKVRFSNHKPISAREAAGDCDFFVGITNLKTTNTRQAIDATFAFFAMETPQFESEDQTWK